MTYLKGENRFETESFLRSEEMVELYNYTKSPLMQHEGALIF